MTYDPKYRMKHRVTPIARLKKQPRPLTMVGDPYFKDWLEHDRVLYAEAMDEQVVYQQAA